MNAILADSYLDTKVGLKYCMYYGECDCTKTRMCRRSMGRERKVGRKLETVQMTAAEEVPRMLKYDEYYSIKSRTGNVPT